MNFRNPTLPSSYELLDHRPLPLWSGEGFVFRHASGARILSICNQDDNKTFGVFFPTPPSNHTGLPHILEHCVLCGSDRFRVKEPFKELLKTSLQTFLNAFTYPDRTCYPVASQNTQDFYNLIEVYLDAVFHPRLTPAVLGQEGWRLQTARDGESWEIQGVVYNEMKGAYASADARLETEVQKELFPDTCYRWDYGGDPAHIPELSFEEFQAFHQAHYHPANAWIAFYGNDDPSARLEKVDAVLRDLPAGPVPDLPALQAPWTTPKAHSFGYPASEGSDEGIFCQLSWLLSGDTSDSMHMQTAGLASTLLLNSPSSPLRLALLESGLGDDIIGGPGFHLRQPTFGAGLKGVEAGDESAVFDCVLSCLDGIAKNGFRPDLVEGVLTLSDFQMRELNTSNKGLWSLLSSVQPWIYGGDPLEALDPEPRLQRIRKAVEQDPHLFADWVRRELVDNTSRVETILRPDSTLGAREREEEKRKLEAFTRELNADPEKKSRAEALAEAVARFQETPDSPEDVAALPRLQLEDIEPLPEPPALETVSAGGHDLTTTHVDSNGIVYLQFAFDFSHLPLQDLHLLPLYSRCLTELGTTSRDQLVFNEQLACHTGGIHVQFETSPTYSGGSLAVMLLKLKCVTGKLDAALDLLTDLLTQPLLGPADKVHQLLLEERANEESELQVSGNQTVSLRLKAGFTTPERASEEMDGVQYLEALRTLEQMPPEQTREKLQSLHHRLCVRSGLRPHVGGDAEGREQALERLPALLEQLPQGKPSTPAGWPVLDTNAPEALLLTSPVQYVGLATRLPDSPATRHFSHFVAQRLLNNDYLWEQVRMQGGAYGCSSAFTHLDRLFVLTSYRDPHIDRTLDLYRRGGEWLQQLSLTPSSLEQAVIGTIGKLSPPERPTTLVSKSFFRHLIGLTHETRQRFWREVRETNPDHLHAFGEAVSEAIHQRETVCVLGGSDAVRNSRLPFHTHPVL